MTIAYTVIFTLSLLLPIGYYVFVYKKQKEPWLFVLYISVCIVNLGYALLSASKTVEFALFANKVAYLGQSFIPLCMFMIISGLCGYRYKKHLTFVLIATSVLMFAMVLTTGHLDWYYKSVELIFVDGAAKLVKEYGFLHPFNLIFVLAYFVAMLAVISVSLKNSKGKSQKLAGLMLAVVIGNIGMWIVEKLITWNFEFLSVSYLMSEFVFFFVYWILQDYIQIGDLPTNEKPSVIFVDSKDREIRLNELLSKLPEGTNLSSRQLDVLEGIINGKSRKEIAIDLHLSENTVKMHTSSLFKELGVSSREEIYSLMK